MLGLTPLSSAPLADAGGGPILTGVIDAPADASGTLINDASLKALEGTAAAAADVAASLTKIIDAQGTADAEADAAAAGVIQSPAGTQDAAGDASGTLTAVPILSGTVASAGEATGELSNPTRALQGTADAAADASGAIAKTAAGTADAAADVSGAPARNLTGTQDAAANLGNTAYLTPQEDALARAFAPIKINVQANGTAAAPIKIDVQSAAGTATAPIKINVQGTGTATAPIVIAVVSSLSVQSWTLTASIGGVDVSSSLTGQLSVRMEEGGSRNAEFSLHVASVPVNPLSYVGKTVSIDLVRMISGVSVSAPLFRGVVEYPTYQPRAALLRLSCSQDLQHILAALDRTAIDSITGGGYHRAVHGDIADNWDYAQACMSTQPASLDCGVMGNPRKTLWDGLPVWKTFGVSEIDEPDIGIEFPRRADLVNQVDCTFEYRYHHLRERHEWLGWSGSWLEVEKTGPDQFPTVQDIESAVSGAGWQIVSGVYFGLPERVPYADGYIEIPRTACGNATVHAAQRHGQAVTETSTLKVTAPASITNSGTLSRELRGALSSEWEPSAWESDIYAPLTGVAEAAAAGITPFAGGFTSGYAGADALAATSSQSLGDFAQVPGGYDGGNMEMDWAPDAPRADAEAGILSLLNTAKVMILGSHRHARVSAAFEILPELDTDRAAGISIGSLSITGKVVAVEHVLDIDSGEASTRFTLAPSGIGAAGLVTETPVAAPVVNAADLLKNAAGEDIYSVPVLGSHRAGLTPYTDNLMGWLVTPPKTLTIVDVPDGQGNLIEKTVENPYYTPNGYPVTGFRVKMPGVDDARRNPAKTNVNQDYLVKIPEDTFSL